MISDDKPFILRLAQDARDLRAAQRLRYEVFVQELGANAGNIGVDDIVVKLTGLIDLSTASYDAATNALTLA